MTALEALTGGMLTILSEWKHSGQRCQELIEKEGLLKLENFSSAVDACWHCTKFVSGFRDVVKVNNTMYDLCPVGYLKDSWKFVNSLLQFNPKERATISEALNAPFLTKTINPPLKCRVKCYGSPLYFGM